MGISAGCTAIGVFGLQLSRFTDVRDADMWLWCLADGDAVMGLSA